MYVDIQRKSFTTVPWWFFTLQVKSEYNAALPWSKVVYLLVQLTGNIIGPFLMLPVANGLIVYIAATAASTLFLFLARRDMANINRHRSRRNDAEDMGQGGATVLVEIPEGDLTDKQDPHFVYRLWKNKSEARASLLSPASTSYHFLPLRIHMVSAFFSPLLITSIYMGTPPKRTIPTKLPTHIHPYCC